jgi:hypothetical protein
MMMADSGAAGAKSQNMVSDSPDATREIARATWIARTSGKPFTDADAAAIRAHVADRQAVAARPATYQDGKDAALSQVRREAARAAWIANMTGAK